MKYVLIPPGIYGHETINLASNFSPQSFADKDSFLRALREVAPEMELFLENLGQYI